jgi:hypothetical protein
MKNLMLLTSFVLLITSCGGGGGSGGSDSPTATNPDYGTQTSGVFVDSPVVGLKYTTNSGLSGMTDDNGVFDCHETSTVTFFIGTAKLGSISCSGVVTPMDVIFGSIDSSTKTAVLTDDTASLSTEQNVKLNKLKNMLSLLQSLDSDSSKSGIQISVNVANAFSNTVGTNVLDFSDSSFGISKNVTDITSEVSTASGETLSPVTTANALSHFQTTLSTPLVSSLNISTTEDNSKNVSVEYLLDGEYFTDGVFSVGVTTPTKGTFSCSSNTCTYTPNANENGVDSFTYKVVSNSTTSVEKTVTVTISSVNDTPTITNPNYSETVSEDSLLNVINPPVVSDVDGDTTSFSISSQSTNGTVVYNSSTNKFQYSPNLNFFGVDSFSYTVSDGSLSSSGTVSLTVSPVNDAPTLTITSSLNAIASDSVNNEIGLVTEDVDGDTLSLVVVSGASNGVASCSTTCTYTPNGSFTGTDSFTVKANDGTLDSPTLTVNLNVTDTLSVLATYLVKNYDTTTETVSSLVLADNFGAGNEGNKRLYFKTNRGEDPTSVSSINSENLVFEYDRASLDTSKLVVRVSTDSGYSSLLPVSNEVILDPQGSGVTSFRVRAKDTVTNEVSAWRTVSLTMTNTPTTNDVAMGAYDAETHSITLDYNSDGVNKITLSNFNNEFGTNLTLLINDNSTSTSSDVEVTASDSIKVQVALDYLVSSQTLNLFNYTVTSSFDITSPVSAVSFSDSEGAILKNLLIKRQVATALMANLQQKVNQAVSNSYPWKGYEGTCSINSNEVVVVSPVGSDMTRNFTNAGSGWTFVHMDDSATTSNTKPYIMGIKKFTGYKVLMTPIDSSGNKIRSLNDVTYSYNIDYAQGGNYDSFDESVMVGQATGEFTAFMNSVTAPSNTSKDVSFDISVVFSDTDLTHSNFTWDNVDTNFKKNKMFVSGNSEAIYVSGEMNSVNTYKLSMSRICGESDTTYQTGTLTQTSAVGVPTIDWLTYGESLSDDFVGQATYAMAFVSGASVKLSSDDSSVLSLFSLENSFYDLSRDAVGVSFQVQMSVADTSLDRIFPNYQYSLNMTAYLGSFLQYQVKPVSDVDAEFYIGHFFDEDDTTIVQYSSKVIDTNDITHFLVNGGEAPTYSDELLGFTQESLP